jgi:hypothetical protein
MLRESKAGTAGFRNTKEIYEAKVRAEGLSR